MPLAEHDDESLKIKNIKAVSIHVPLAEHDPGRNIPTAEYPRFNSRAPRGARRQAQERLTCTFRVSIHVPLAEHDPCGKCA